MKTELTVNEQRQLILLCVMYFGGMTTVKHTMLLLNCCEKTAYSRLKSLVEKIYLNQLEVSTVAGNITYYQAKSRLVAAFDNPDSNLRKPQDDNYVLTALRKQYLASKLYPIYKNKFCLSMKDRAIFLLEKGVEDYDLPTKSRESIKDPEKILNSVFIEEYILDDNDQVVIFAVKKVQDKPINTICRLCSNFLFVNEYEINFKYIIVVYNILEQKEMEYELQTREFIYIKLSFYNKKKLDEFFNKPNIVQSNIINFNIGDALEKFSKKKEYILTYKVDFKKFKNISVLLLKDYFSDNIDGKNTYNEKDIS